DEVRDEALSMGERALFIEHPTDRSNTVKVNQVSSFSLPWADPQKIPYTIMGPYLKPLFDRAFIDGLH
ncbi:kinase, partial [Klebsiella pneumoniae]